MITAIRPYAAQNKKLQSQSQSRRKFSAQGDTLSFGNNSKNLSFFDKVFSKIGENKTVKGIIDWASKEKTIVKHNGDVVVKRNSDKLAQYMMVAFSAVLQSNHVFNIMRNKEIPQDRKEVLAVNNGLTFVIPTIGAFTVDGIIHKKVDDFQQYLKEVNGKHLSKEALEGVKAAKTILIFTMMYKYASTLVAMPMANGVTNFMRRNGVFGDQAKQKELEIELSKLKGTDSTAKSPSK